MSPTHSRLRAVFVLAGCAALLPGCGGGAEDSEGASVEAAGRSGADGTDAAAPASGPRPVANQEFPVPTPEGGEIITDGWDGTTGHITVRYPAARHEEIIAFYDDYASGSGWNRSEIGQGDLRTVNQMNLMEGLNISVDPPEGESMIVTLTVS